MHLTAWIPKYIKIPPFTAPFVLITWLIIILQGALHFSPAENITNFSNNISSFGIGEAVGQVYIQNNSITGFVILFAILLYSKSGFYWAMIATLMSWLTAFVLGYSILNIENGLYGFSAVLTGIALKELKPILFPIAGIILSVLITHAFIISDWPSLTAPFVLASWLITVIYQLFSNQVQEK